MYSTYSKALFVILLSFFLLPQSAFAGSLSFSPASGDYSVGQTFTVRVLASSYDAINAASALVNFPPQKLRVVSIAKSPSILTLWVQEPSFSNTAGTVSFEGVVPNPGFTGGSGAMLSITFKVLAEGVATVKFSSGSLLANDGEGTNVASSMNSANFTFTPAVDEPDVEVTPKKVVPVPTPAVSATPSSQTEPQVVESIKAPIITEYPEKLQEGTPLVVKGNTYPNAGVIISLRDTRGQIFTQVAESNNVGDFSILWSSKLDRDTYELTSMVVYRGVRSLASEPHSISIIPTPLTRLKFEIIDYTTLLMVIIVCLAILVLTLLYLFRNFSKFKKKLWKETVEIERDMHEEFDELTTAVRKELRTLEKVKTKRELTQEESMVLEKITRHISRIEKKIDRKIEVVKDDLK